MSWEMVMGSLTTPLSKRFTLATSAACAFGSMFLCTMPMPPSCAMAMARRASVTVSMAADISGILSAMLLVSCVVRLTSRGRTVEWAGTSRTSSKVSAFCRTRILLILHKDAIIQTEFRVVNPRPAAVFQFDLQGSSSYGLFMADESVNNAPFQPLNPCGSTFFWLRYETSSIDHQENSAYAMPS